MRISPRSLALVTLGITALACFPSCRVADRVAIAMDPTTIRTPTVDEIEELEAREAGQFPGEGMSADSLTEAEAAMQQMAIPGYNGQPIPGYTPSNAAAAAAAAAQAERAAWPKPPPPTRIPGYTPSADTPNVRPNGAPVPPSPTPGTPTYDPSLIRDLQQ